MKASVIIPTYNGGHKISRVLESLQKQTINSFEVIIAIDGSTDNTYELVKSYAKSFHSFKVIYQDNAGRSIVRNRGAEEASGDILIFYDDDMEPNIQSIERHINFHLHNDGLLSGNQMEFVSQKKTDIQNYKAFLTHEWTKKYSDGLNKLNEHNLFFTAANCSIQKKTFLSLDGFDKRLTDAEDFDLALRAMQKDISVYFDKGNEAIHSDPITCRSYIARIRQYQLAQEKLVRLHPERKKNKTSINLLRGVSYWFLSFGSFPFLIDRFNIFMILPKAIRYKLYSAIIHSLGLVHPQVKLW